MTPILLTLSEHGSKTIEIRDEHPWELQAAAARLCGQGICRKFAARNGDSADQAALEFIARRKDDAIEVRVDVAYFVGFDWIIPGMLGVRVQPKLDGEARRIDILKVLRQALAERENFENLDGLLRLDFTQPERMDEDDAEGLGLFIATAYLCVLSKIVRKGLQRNFYQRDETFRRKIKGRILFSPTVSGRRTPRISDRLSCTYQEFGVDVPANRVLKRALRMVMRFLQTKAKAVEESAELLEKARKLLQAFAPVSDERVAPAAVDSLSRAVNPLFRDYRQALRFAQKILRMETLGSGETARGGSIPVHWINMPQLFELYVLAKLRKVLRSNDRIRYQFGANRQYPDFLCRADADSCAAGVPAFFIADAKYKPRYADGNSGMVDDIRQLSGYARLAGVIEEFERWGWCDPNRVLPCIIVYSDQKLPYSDLDWARLEEIPRWMSFYKIGIRLPECR